MFAFTLQNAKDVAQTTAQLVKTLNTDYPNALSDGTQVVQIAKTLKDSVSKLADSLMEDGREVPVQVLPEAANVRYPTVFIF